MKFTPYFFLAFTVLIPSSLLHAGDPSPKLQETIYETVDALFGECGHDLELAEKQGKVRAIIDQNYNFEVIVRRAMGRNWNHLTIDQQPEVLELIEQLVIKAYVEGLNKKGRPEITFGETTMISDMRAEVPSLVKVGDNTVNVIYRMGKMRSGWEVFDIVAEDISVVSNYRQQFDDHFRKDDVAALIKKLEKLLEKQNLDEEIQL